jgi:hypothetical protein
VIRPYVLHVVFWDGVERTVDVDNLLDGEVFRPLRDPSFFAKVEVNPVLDAGVWPNAAHLAPGTARPC